VPARSNGGRIRREGSHVYKNGINYSEAAREFEESFVRAA